MPELDPHLKRAVQCLALSIAGAPAQPEASHLAEGMAMLLAATLRTAGNVRHVAARACEMLTEANPGDLPGRE